MFLFAVVQNNPCKISMFLHVSVAEWADLSLTLSGTPTSGFSRRGPDIDEIFM